MKIIIPLSFFISINSLAQVKLNFGEVQGKSITRCDEKKDGKICYSSNQFEISLSVWQSQTPISKTVTLSYDGFNWKAARFEKGWKKDSVTVFNLKPTISYDSIFAAIKQNNVFTLPNQTDLKISGAVDDGVEYVLVYKVNDTYRRYSFNNVNTLLESNRNVPEMINYANLENIFFSWLTKE